MIKLIKVVLSLTTCILIFSGCESEMDKYYKTPSGVAPPIYQQLQESGRFTIFLKCVDKAGYKDVLNKTGYLTVFAPSDSAFNAYFAENGKTFNDIDSVKAREIVTYSTLYNAYRISDFDRYQNGSRSTESDSLSFRRKTYYYKGFYYESVNVTGGSVLAAILDVNATGGTVDLNDNNNKYIPIFTSAYFSFNKLKPDDYNLFFPNSNFTGQNVANASIIKGDFQASNGYFHEIDKVLEPLPNIDEYLASQPKYSKFRQLLDTLKSYITAEQVRQKFENLPNKPQGITNVYYKYYNTFFFPNNENYSSSLKQGGQSNCYTLFAPDNEAFDEIMNKRLMLYSKTKDYHQLQLSVLHRFVNAHMFASAAFPSNPSNATNLAQEDPRFDFGKDINEAKFCSNGIFYGVKKAQSHDLFETVYGDLYLNPEASIFMYGVGLLDMTNSLLTRGMKYSLFVFNDQYFKDKGFEYNPSRTGYPLFYKGRGKEQNTIVSPITTTWFPDDTLKKQYMKNQITKMIPDISGKGCIETYAGDAIGYENYTLFGAGNQDIGEVVNCTAITGSEPVNGNVFYCDKPVRLSERPVGEHLQKYFGTTRYWAYLSVNPAYNATTKTLNDLKANVLYTILVPDDNAIQDAITKGDLPDSPTKDVEKIKRFIQLHIIKGKSICADGSIAGNGPFLTLLVGGESSAKVTVTNTIGNLSFVDQKNNPPVYWDPDNSNKLSNKAIIHTIKGYLKY